MIIPLALGLLTALIGGADQAAPHGTQDQAPAYTLSGVRRAGSDVADKGEQPSESPVLPAKPLARRAAQPPFSIETWIPKGSAVSLPQSDRFVTGSLGPIGPAWHQAFLGMTQPRYGSSPYDMLGNRGRLEGAASSMAFALAVEGATRLVQGAVRSYKKGKVEKLRREIEAERLEAERLHQAGKAGRVR